MVQQVEHPDEAEAGGEKDFPFYDARLAFGNGNGESTGPRDTSWGERRPQTIAEEPPTETLLEIEAWIAAQDARTRANNRVLAEFQAACADAQARADNLARELKVAQNALRTTIAHLKAERTAHSTAFEELAATRAREQKSYAVRQEEIRAAAETLTIEFQALEERYRRSTESLAAREAELAEARAARTALEETLHTVRTSGSAHAVRVAELEALATDLGHALQAQTEATNRANASTETCARELADKHSRASALEAQLQAAMRHATDLAAAAQSTETTLKMHIEQLAESEDRLANFEREATYQADWRTTLEVELAHAEWLAEQAEASRRPVEKELGRVRTELQRETERANALDATQRELALELERTRSALDEREFQLRRLERYADTSTQELSRVKFGTACANGNPLSETLEFPDDGATLVPLDDGEAQAIPLGRHTTIGRAPESHLRLRDSTVSRRHAVVTIGPNGAFIEDLRSVNGVTVNSQRIRHARLADGDVIELGAKRFRFTSSAGERSARSAHSNS
jgi:chromosome segregation ATPase